MRAVGSDAAIWNLAAAVRRLYVRESQRWYLVRGRRAAGVARRWDGPLLGDGQSIWRLVAEFVLQHQLCAESLVLAVFSAAERERECPQPARLRGELALQNYRAYAAYGKEEAAERWRQQQLRFTAAVRTAQHGYGWSANQAALFVLSSTHVELSPLFRYVVAAAGGAQDIAAWFEDAARSQYSAGRPLYKDVCGESVPAAWNRVDADAVTRSQT